jgi:nucleoside triphosphate pyrophosphatase
MTGPIGEGTPDLVLASASPRRAHLLEMLGLSFRVRPANIDESLHDAETPVAHAERLSVEKARAIADLEPHAIVVGSDTVVVVDDVILGKPGDRAEAVAMLLRLQGREHIVLTGVAVVRDGRCWSAIERVSVRFRAFDAETARRYAETGEPMDKAGAYGIQGYGATLVERIEGDFFAVMGLPVARLVTLLEAAGYRYTFGGGVTT